MSKLLETTYSIADIAMVSKQILEQTTSKTLLFYGDMGVGKTTLIKSLVKTLGSTDVVTSPTFSIVNEYLTNDTSIFHFDLYRIEDEEEALNFGIEDYLNTSNWVFIEWPERIKNLIPEEVNCIELTYKNETFRSLEISNKRILTPNKTTEQCKF